MPINMYSEKVTKIEKYWRAESGIKSSSIKKTKSKKKVKSEDDEKAAPPLANSAQAQKDALEKGAGLKKYLQKNQCFTMDLLMVCVASGILHLYFYGDFRINSNLIICP